MILVLECVALIRITLIASGSPIIAYWEINNTMKTINTIFKATSFYTHREGKKLIGHLSNRSKQQ